MSDVARATTKGPSGRQAASIIRDLTRKLRHELDRIETVAWPNPRWANDPVGFVREVLGEQPLPHQAKILEAARDEENVAVRSGQKTGKTKLVVWAALWWYCTRSLAEVVMTAPVKNQVRTVLWKELRNTVRKAKLKGFRFEDIPENPETGVRSEDGRVIRGITVRDKEALAGISGPALLFIGDEASAMSHDVNETLEGNTAGGGKRLYISNPTRTDGPFFDIFHNEAMQKLWKRFHLSSEDVANYCAEHGVTVPGVATKLTIDRWAESYGKDSPFYLVRVVGDFLRNETGKIISLERLTRAVEEHGTTEATGRLRIGIDPAGEGVGGDEFTFSIVRGLKLLGLFAFRGLSEEAAIAHLRSFLKTYRQGDEIPDVVIDSEGPIGSALYGRLKGIAETLKKHRPADSFEIWGIKASHWARREPMVYDRLRDELWANAARWFKEGGTIFSDPKLETELHAPFWVETIGGKLKATPKDELREQLGRSTDRADAFLLSVWEPAPWLAVSEEESAEEKDTLELYARDVPALPGVEEIPFDPYTSGGGFDGGGYDPYGR